MSVYRALNSSDGNANNKKVRFSLMDGEKLLASSEPEDEDAPYLVGIAATGEEDGDSEILYGITEWGDLYRFTLTETKGPDSDEQTLSIGGFERFGVLDGYNTDDKYLSSASLLYDTASGYLLAAVTYLSSGVDTSALYLIDPDNPNDYVTVDLPAGVELNSLYQYTQKSTAGVQLYLTADQTSVKVDNTIKATAEAYQYSTDTAGLVTNEPLTSVTWSSSDPTVAKVENDGTVTGLEPGKATITATATTDKGSDSKSFEVTVNPNTGSKVGALIAVSSGKADYVWATIDLDAIDNDNGKTFQTVTSDVELKNEYTDWNSGEKVKTYWPGGGYAQGLLWGNYYIGDPSTSYYYTLNATTYNNEEPVNETKGHHDSDRRIADLTDSPVINGGISNGDTKTKEEDLARVVFVTQGGDIAWLTGDGTRDSQGDSYSAIAYVGDLKAEQVKGVSSLQCDLNSTCHVYYALKKDGTLNQVILVPRVGELKNEFDHRYSLSETTIGKVTFDTNSAETTSMDFLWKDADHYGLLVARSDKSIQYIELKGHKGHTSGAALTATLVGNLSKVNLKGGTTTDVNGVSALYHTGNVTLSDKQILSIVGWDKQQSPQSAPMAAPAISVLSGEGASGGTDASTPIEVSITADKDATNGKWTVTYNATKLQLDTVSKDAGIVYSKFNDDGTGTVTLAFASRSAIDQGNALFTLTFTKLAEDASDKDVTVTCDELNQPATKPSGGGGGGGSTGSATNPVTPAQPDNGSVSIDKKNAAQGDTVTITVQPDARHRQGRGQGRQGARGEGPRRRQVQLHHAERQGGRARDLRPGDRRLHGRPGGRLLPRGGPLGRGEGRDERRQRHPFRAGSGLHPCADRDLPLARGRLARADGGGRLHGRPGGRLLRQGGGLGRGERHHHRRGGGRLRPRRDVHPRPERDLPLPRPRRHGGDGQQLHGRPGGRVVRGRGGLGRGEGRDERDQREPVRPGRRLHPRADRDLPLARDEVKKSIRA